MSLRTDTDLEYGHNCLQAGGRAIAAKRHPCPTKRLAFLNLDNYFSTGLESEKKRGDIVEKYIILMQVSSV